MKIVTLASGSKGNCTLLQTDRVKILIDAGINLAEIEDKLRILDVNPKDIAGILVTHEHSDHIKGLGPFARKYGSYVFAHSAEWKILEEKIGRIDIRQKKEFVSSSFFIEDLTVNSFQLSHDCNLCLGYSFFNQGNKISIATDLGIVTPSVIENLKDSLLIILEANHDEKLLLNNTNYSSVLKQRILSNRGHLSNLATATAIANIMNSNLKQIVLAHLSEENNSPELAYKTIKQELLKYGIVEGENLFIDVSTQHEIGSVFDIKN